MTSQVVMELRQYLELDQLEEVLSEVVEQVVETISDKSENENEISAIFFPNLASYMVLDANKLYIQITN